MFTRCLKWSNDKNGVSFTTRISVTKSGAKDSLVSSSAKTYSFRFNTRCHLISMFTLNSTKAGKLGLSIDSNESLSSCLQQFALYPLLPITIRTSGMVKWPAKMRESKMLVNPSLRMKESGTNAPVRMTVF